MGWDEKKELPQTGSTGLGASLVAISENIYKLTTSQNLASGELSYTSAIGQKFRIKQVLIHASVSIASKTIQLKFNSGTGSNYDTIMAALDFESNQDVAFIPGQNCPDIEFTSGDEFDLVSNGTTIVGILYVTIIYELIG